MFNISKIFEKVATFFEGPKSTFTDYSFVDGQVLPVLPENHTFRSAKAYTMSYSRNCSAVMQVAGHSGEVLGNINFAFDRSKIERFREEVKTRNIPAEEILYVPAPSPPFAVVTYKIN